jgi:serine/threonine protein phosphatase 1
MHRRFFIGDVHGHYEGLMTLLDKLAPSIEDEIYFVGDLIDRGPLSIKVVEFVKNSPYTCVLGNHEQMILEALYQAPVKEHCLQAWLYSGGQITLASYGSEADLLMEHLHWLNELPLYLDLGDVWLVHAGVDPHLRLEEQTADEFCWVRDNFHNATTPYFADKLIITGHTITFTFTDVLPGQIVTGPGWIDIDTGAYHPKSGWLTAVDIDNEIVHQVNVFESAYQVRSLQEASTSFSQPRKRLFI